MLKLYINSFGDWGLGIGDWEQIIMAKEDGVLPAEVLSGKLRVETYFLVKGKVLYKNKILIYYV